MNGMNPEPMASYSLADRFVCAKCGTAPHIKSAEGRDPMMVVLECHGETLKKSYPFKELVFTQVVFDGK